MSKPKLPAQTGQPQDGEDPVGELLTPRQDQAVAALLNEPTIGRAAAASGVNERTLRRWLKNPVFRTAVSAARREAFGQAIALTVKYAPVGVASLVRVIQDQTVHPAARVTAAAVLLKFGRESIELDDLAERVEALERAMPVLPAPPLTEDVV